MAIGIDADGANIPNINVVDQGSDPTTPAAGHVRLYTKSGVLYARTDDGTVTAVGSVVALAEGQLAVGDASDELSALALGTEGQVVTADASGMATWADAPTGAGGDLSLISETLVGAGGAASVDIQNIPGTYRHLELRILARGELNATSDAIRLIFNNDSGNNYSTEYAQSSGTTTTTGQQTDASNVGLGSVSAATAPAGDAGELVVSIPHYAGTTFRKRVNASGGLATADTAGNHWLWRSSTKWKNTAAITRITVSCGGGDLAEGSIVSLYGLAGA